jgi:hypothetical protein
MRTNTVAGEPQTIRRVFASWSIEIPASFIETFILEPGYWHAYDEGRSISLSSFVVTDGKRQLSSAELREVLPDLDGSPVQELPPSLSGRAVIVPSTEPIHGSNVLEGVLAFEGRMLLVTITGHDLDWARRVWLSIRNHLAPVVLSH